MALTRALHASSSSHASAKFTRSETKHAWFRRASAIAVGVCDVKLLDTIAGFLLGAAGIERSTTVRVVRLADGASAWHIREASILLSLSSVVAFRVALAANEANRATFGWQLLEGWLR